MLFMVMKRDHRVEQILNQLFWIQRRRDRISDSVSSHFGREKVSLLLKGLSLKAPQLSPNFDYRLLQQGKSDEEFVRELALHVEYDEALVVKTLRERASPYPAHVDEQILFGARNAGQDAGRFILQRDIDRSFTLPEVFQAIESLSYLGLASDQNYFVTLRPLGHISVHHERCPHLKAWTEAGAEVLFQEKLQAAWTRGIIDILSPQTFFERKYSIPRGDAFGLDYYIPGDKNINL